MIRWIGMAALPGALWVAMSAQAAPQQRLATVSTQDSFNARLIRAADFCLGWVQRRQAWSGDDIEMEDLHGPPTADEPGDLWDMNHRVDISIAALGPDDRGCVVAYTTDQWDKNVALKLLGNWMTAEKAFAFVYDEDVENGKKITMQQGAGTVAKITVFSRRPGDDEAFSGMDGTAFFSE